MNKKHLVIALLFLGLVFGVLLLRRQTAKIEIVESPILSEENRSLDDVTLILDYGDGIVATYSAQARTAYEALEVAASAAAIPVEALQYDFGVFVQSIDGRESTVQRAWIYFVNGESGQIAADQSVVSAGDVVEWRYVEPN